MNKDDITDWFKSLQEDISSKLVKLDGKGTFREDIWERRGGGGGRTRVMEGGNIIEKGGVNFSSVFGELSENISLSQRIPYSSFYATGISIVLHPYNPMLPIIHMNTRYFEMGSGERWFGGGIDLTPHYVSLRDASFFHNYLKKVADQFDPAYYPTFKKAADDYFFIPHRNETRGIGGIFFDRLFDQDENNMIRIYRFTQAVGSSFFPVYEELVKRNMNKDFSEREKLWQAIRRGRYVEFNLVLDKGTRFGLETDGRTESILMSLPSSAKWIYDYQPECPSKEEETMKWLKKGINWIHLSN